MGNLNKTEKELLREGLKSNQPSSYKKYLQTTDNPTSKGYAEFLENMNKKKKDIDRTEEYFDFMEGKKDESYNVMEAAKGGEVKKYMGGGSVHKKKNKMITTRGWGASRKT